MTTSSVARAIIRTMSTLTPLRAVNRDAPGTATLNQALADRSAREALHRRLDQLEADRDQLERSVRLVEGAVKWLSPRDRTRARRRLRKLGHDEQVDAFADLHDVIDGEVAA